MLIYFQLVDNNTFFGREERLLKWNWMFSLTWQKWIWIIRGLLTYPCVLIVLFRNMCWNLLTSTGHTTSKYLYTGDVVGPGERIPLPQVFRIRWFNSDIVILKSNCKQTVKCLLFTVCRWLWRWSKTVSPGAANKWCYNMARKFA